jgi:hypothetical protein
VPQLRYRVSHWCQNIKLKVCVFVSVDVAIVLMTVITFIENLLKEGTVRGPIRQYSLRMKY